MLVELRAEKHGVDRYRLTVIVENDDLKQATGSVCADVEVAVALPNHTDGVADCVVDVLICDTVPAGIVRDLHISKLPCLADGMQVTLRCAASR